MATYPPTAASPSSAATMRTAHGPSHRRGCRPRASDVEQAGPLGASSAAAAATPRPMRTSTLVQGITLCITRIGASTSKRSTEGDLARYVVFSGHRRQAARRCDIDPWREPRTALTRHLPLRPELPGPPQPGYPRLSGNHLTVDITNRG